MRKFSSLREAVANATDQEMEEILRQMSAVDWPRPIPVSERDQRPREGQDVLLSTNGEPWLTARYEGGGFMSRIAIDCELPINESSMWLPLPPAPAVNIIFGKPVVLDTSLRIESSGNWTLTPLPPAP